MVGLLFLSRYSPRPFLFFKGGKYGVRLSLGASECEVYDNVMSDSTRYGVFFYRGSDEAEVSSNTRGCVCRALIDWVDIVVAVVCFGLVS